VAVSARGARSVSLEQPVSCERVGTENASDDGQWPVRVMTQLEPVMCAGNSCMPKI
jgi:hypothetical protein